MDERAFSAGQAFLLSAKLFWTHQLFGAVKDEVRTASPQPKTLADVAKVLSPSTTYAYFEWFERHLQKMKYSGRYGLVPHADGLRRELLARLDVNSPTFLAATAVIKDRKGPDFNVCDVDVAIKLD